MKTTATLALAALVIAAPALAMAANPFAPHPAAPVTTAPPPTTTTAPPQDTTAAPLTQGDGSSALFAQFQAASSSWLGTLGDTDGYMVNYPKSVADGINGRWADISALHLTAENTALFAKQCDAFGYDVLAKSPLTIKMVMSAGKDDQVTFTYNSAGGNRYSASVDAAEFYHHYKLDQPGVSTDVRLQSIARMDGIARLFRPSPDILIIQTNDGIPRGYARCAEE